MKFGAHQSFHMRDSWLYKGLHSTTMLGSEDAVFELGVGKNMVAAIKYWLTALRLVENIDSQWIKTQLSESILRYDPYFEHDGTLLQLHYELATNQDEATAFYWFFNKFGATEFDAESLLVYFSTFVQNNLEKSIKDTTLKKDIDCLLRTYIEPNYLHKMTPETENPSPFVKFGFLEKRAKKIVKKKLKIEEVDAEIFVHLIHEHWSKRLQEAASVNLEELVDGDCSPGKVFGLSIDDMIDVIERINHEYPDKYLKFSRTGGYSIITLNKKACSKALEHYYSRLNKDIV